MTRRLLNLLTALSLLLCVIVVALWFDGGIYYFGHRPRWSVTAERGTLTIHRGFDNRWNVEAHWVLLAGLVLPVEGIIRRRARQLSAYRAGLARRAGVCPQCGYDLRATPDRCPECGRDDGGETARESARASASRTLSSRPERPAPAPAPPPGS